jgi:tRNA U34 5-carboxymethylaminomethyl modifying enzyme MnmG/GidA
MFWGEKLHAVNPSLVEACQTGRFCPSLSTKVKRWPQPTNKSDRLEVETETTEEQVFGN